MYQFGWLSERGRGGGGEFFKFALERGGIQKEGEWGGGAGGFPQEREGFQPWRKLIAVLMI